LNSSPNFDDLRLDIIKDELRLDLDFDNNDLQLDSNLSPVIWKDLTYLLKPDQCCNIHCSLALYHDAWSQHCFHTFGTEPESAW